MKSIIENGVLIEASAEDLIDGKFIIPEGITKIKGSETFDMDENAFESITKDGKIIEVQFPGSQELIEPTFADCKCLQNVTVCEGVKEIDAYAFISSSLKSINLPKSLIRIGYDAFENTELESINIPGGVSRISEYAFSRCKKLKNLILNEGTRVIDNGAFNECVNLTEIRIPNSVEFIGRGAFFRCHMVDYIYIKGKRIQATPELVNNLGECYDFLCYAIENNKFIPKNIAVLKNTPKKDIENYYKHADVWREVLTTYLKKWKTVFESRKDAKLEMENAVENLYQACLVLGLFQDGENGKTAREFIDKTVMHMSPDIIHKFGGMETKEFGYNEEFAQFYIKNYNGNMEFLHGHEYAEDTDWGDEIVDYTAKAYNNWAQIKEVYPNKTVLAHREHASENNNLTEEDVIRALNQKIYESVNEGNEEMADMVGKYGYSQSEFDELQEWFNKAKKITADKMILRAEKDTQEMGVTFELLAKDNPEALILGEKTNCCQTINDAGSSCVEYGATKTNSGFIKFCVNGKICGQSWVWYNEETGIVCLDNIEIPTIWQKEFKKKELEKSFVSCLQRLAVSFKTEMERHGHQVNGVTIGAGYNDLPAVEQFKKITATRDVLPRDYNGYSDAKNTQYIIPFLHKTSVNDFTK